MKRRHALLVCAALAAGCSVLPPAPEPPSLHVIDALPPPAAAASRRPFALEVGPVRAAPGCDTSAMMYTTQPHALEPFADHRWADTPARMLAPLVLRTLEDGGRFAAVVPGPTSVAADLRLDVELLALKQDFTVKPSRVVVALRLQVVDLHTRKPLATRYVEVSEAAPADGPAGGVAAANAAVRKALAELASFTAAAVP